MLPCSVAGCTRRAVKLNIPCPSCVDSYCFEHGPSHHTCPDPDKDIDAFYAASKAAQIRELTDLCRRFDTAAICAHASSLRAGMPCDIPTVSSTISDMMGGQHVHLDLVFNDDIHWIVRIQRIKGGTAPPTARAHFLLSEVATLRFLGRIGVPVPKVYGFRLPTADDSGIGHMFMEKLPGVLFDLDSLEKADKQKVLSQLADVYLKIAHNPVDMAGSLDDPSTSHVGRFSTDSFSYSDQDQESSVLGPFSSSAASYESHLRAKMNLIVRQEYAVTAPVDMYLILRSLRDLLPIYLSKIRASSDPGKFYITHADDKGDHILVDSSHNITGIIDWEWARSMSAMEAFAAPLMLIPVADFYEGSNELSTDELALADLFLSKGEARLSDAVLNGRISHRWRFCIEQDGTNMEDCIMHFAALRKPLVPHEIFVWDDWKEHSLAKYAGDAELQALLEQKGLTPSFVN